MFIIWFGENITQKCCGLKQPTLCLMEPVGQEFRSDSAKCFWFKGSHQMVVSVHEGCRHLTVSPELQVILPRWGTHVAGKSVLAVCRRPLFLYSQASSQGWLSIIRHGDRYPPGWVNWETERDKKRESTSQKHSLLQYLLSKSGSLHLAHSRVKIGSTLWKEEC